MKFTNIRRENFWIQIFIELRFLDLDLKSVRPNVISGGQLSKCGDLLEIEIYYNKRKFSGAEALLS